MSDTPSPQESAMPDEQSTVHDTAAANAATFNTAAANAAAANAAAANAAVQAPPQTLAYEPLEEEGDWLEEPEALPRRPRRRLFGVGVNPVPLALLGVLLIACGFIGGVLVEKGQTSSSSGGSVAAGLASRFAALRGAGATGSTTTGSGTGSGGAGSGGAANSGASGGAAGGFAARFGGLGGAGGATIGEVSYISGDTLYVTDAEGNTVKVTTSPASAITKTVKADLHGIHPGETVVIRGAKGSGGVVSAESISVSAAGAAGGGLSSLFGGGSGSGGGSRGAGAASGSSGAGGPALFGG